MHELDEVERLVRALLDSRDAYDAIDCEEVCEGTGIVKGLAEGVVACPECSTVVPYKAEVPIAYACERRCDGSVNLDIDVFDETIIRELELALVRLDVARAMSAAPSPPVPIPPPPPPPAVKPARSKKSHTHANGARQC